MRIWELEQTEVWGREWEVRKKVGHNVDNNERHGEKWKSSEAKGEFKNAS